MKEESKRKKYHKFEDGIKIIKIFTENPGEPWIIGSGPRKPEHVQKFHELMNKLYKGKPKSTEQKYKMRLAKLGVPKSPEHVENMRKAQIVRAQKIKELQQDYPHLKYHEVAKLLTKDDK